MRLSLFAVQQIMLWADTVATLFRVAHQLGLKLDCYCDKMTKADEMCLDSL